MIESSGGRWGSGNGSEDLFGRETCLVDWKNTMLTLDDT